MCNGPILMSFHHFCARFSHNHSLRFLETNMDSMQKTNRDKSVPEISSYENLVEMLGCSAKRFGGQTGFANRGHLMTFGQLDNLSNHFAAWIQNHTDLVAGDAIAIQLPNILQYPVAVFGALKAGLIIVNTNPLYTASEMTEQFQDSGVKALVILSNMATLAEKVLDETKIKHVVVTDMGDSLNPVQKLVTNYVIRNVEKRIPPFELPCATAFAKVINLGKKYKLKPVESKRSDIAMLQYTGGITGTPKGAILTHGNLLTNLDQMVTALGDELRLGEEIMITALPLYHIFSFTVNLLGMIYTGNLSILISNPRNFPQFVKEISKWKFTAITGVNTLFFGLMRNHKFKDLDMSHLRLTISGGMALTQKVAHEWEKVTGCPIHEGYGLTEASPCLTLNHPQSKKFGIGRALPETQIKICDDKMQPVETGIAGEILAKGPQLMAGYWKKHEGEIFTDDGWLKTGDIGIMDAEGFLTIVDRKKDLIIVSGYNVYPSELERTIKAHPEVDDCAAIGVPNQATGETVKVFIVAKNDDLSSTDVRQFCRQKLTGYKIPKLVVFKNSIPRSPMGKVLRKQLREESAAP